MRGVLRLLRPPLVASLLAALVPLRPQRPAPLVPSQLTWFDRAGKMLGRLGRLPITATSAPRPMDRGWPWRWSIGPARPATSGCIR